ncbi:MAG: hypothetical protein ACOY5B_03665 [Spirochaetota bacterium]
MIKWILPVLALAIVQCRKNPHISASEIADLAKVKPEKVLVQKKYQLDSSASFEDITLFEAQGKTHLVIFTPADKGYALLRLYPFAGLLAEPKLYFIAVGNKKSQVLVIHGTEKKTLHLFDAGQFAQEFTPDSADTATVKMTKIEEKPNDELLNLGAVNYRFNGMRWLPWQGDEIFPFLETFEVAGEQSLIEITNRGQFGTRVLLTLAFTDVTAADLTQKLKLTKDIPTVALYRPGASVHKNGGGNVSLPHPLIEIRKDSFGKNGRIKLPLYMNDIKALTMRAVYSQRGQNLNWPAAAGTGVEKDGQGYWAVRR